MTGTVTAGRRPVPQAVVALIPEREPATAALDTALIDQRELAFLPRVLPLRRGAVVEFRNSDPLLHNVFSPSDAEFNLGTYPQGTSRYRTFDREGASVILCHVHPEMVAYVVVVPTPHFSVTDADGRFTVVGLASGSYRVRVWHRAMEPLEQRVTVGPGPSPSLRLLVRPKGSRSPQP